MWLVQSTQPLAERDLCLNPIMQIARNYVLTDIASSPLNINRLTHMFLIKHVSKYSPECA